MSTRSKMAFPTCFWLSMRFNQQQIRYQATKQPNPTQSTCNPVVHHPHHHLHMHFVSIHKENRGIKSTFNIISWCVGHVVPMRKVPCVLKPYAVYDNRPAFHCFDVAPVKRSLVWVMHLFLLSIHVIMHVQVEYHDHDGSLCE